MKANVAGHVRMLAIRKKDVLVPLFEAIMNSLQAIDEVKSQKLGSKHSITIELQRENNANQKLIDGSIEAVGSICGFAVTDTGIGFTKENYASFGEAGSQKKLDIGGKGLGRFSYLAVFDHAEIESKYPENGHFKRRKFLFSDTEKGVSSHSDRKVSDDDRTTTIALNDMKPEFQQVCPKSAEVIARKICAHFFRSLIGKDVPEITILDAVDDTKLTINRLMQQDLLLKSKEEKFEVGEHEFSITHSFVSQKALKSHTLMLCARGRAVDESTKKLERTDTFQPGPFATDEGKPFYYCGAISSDYLDDRVNNSRTRLDIPHGEDEDLYDVSEPQIREAASKLIKKCLKRYTKQPREEHDQRIRKFCENHPSYRILLKHAKKDLKKIPPGLSDDRLELEIIQLYNQHRLRTRERFESLRQKTQRGIKNLERFRKEYRTFLDHQNELAVSELAQYMLDRKAALDALDYHMEADQKGKFPVEEAIHEIIFPLSATSDDLSYEETNLWIIDEKLAFHSYLASDKRISTHEPTTSESTLEPDLAVYFESAFALSESATPRNSVVIVEFKRPQRDDYEPGFKKNPFDQVEQYVRQIRNGKAKDKKGRVISLRKDIPFFAYVIADLLPSLDPMAESRNAIETNDGEGLVYFHAKLNLFVQVISYTKLLADAKLRNKIFFDKLGIDVGT